MAERQPLLRSRPARVAAGVAAVAWAAAIWWLSSQPEPPGSDMVPDVPYVDKLAHAALFGVLAGLTRLAGAGRHAAWLLALTVGAVDELHQAFVPQREPELLDLLADGAGAAAAIAAVEWLARRWGAR